MSVCNCNNIIFLFLFVHFSVLHLVEVNLKKKKRLFRDFFRMKKKKSSLGVKFVVTEERFV